MKCPVCAGVDLKITERQGVEIDYCPECRGIWLDRGELDKILERSQGYAEQRPQPDEYRGQHHDSHHDDHHGYGSHGYHKRKSWLAELFD